MLHILGYFCLAIIILLFLVRMFWWVTSGWYKLQKDWHGKTVVVTGANSGVGFEAAKELSLRGATVYMLCRNEDRAKDAIRQIRGLSATADLNFVQCDLSSLGSVRNAAKELLLKCDSIHVLVNNAGRAGVHGEQPTFTEDNLELTMASNYFGHFLLTALLTEKLLDSAPSRIINVTSLMHRYHVDRFAADNLNFEHGPYKASYGYAYSKLAQVLFTRELAKRLRNTGVIVNCVHPGIFPTPIHSNFLGLPKFYAPLILFIGSFMFQSASEGARTILYLAESNDVTNVSGQYFADCSPKPSSLKSLDNKLAREVFEKSCELTGAEFSEKD